MGIFDFFKGIYEEAKGSAGKYDGKIATEYNRNISNIDEKIKKLESSKKGLPKKDKDLSSRQKERKNNIQQQIHFYNSFKKEISKLHDQIQEVLRKEKLRAWKELIKDVDKEDSLSLASANRVYMRDELKIVDKYFEEYKKRYKEKLSRLNEELKKYL